VNDIRVGKLGKKYIGITYKLLVHNINIFFGWI